MSVSPSPRRPGIRHGLDFVDVPRVRTLLAQHDAFARKVFTPDEQAYCERYPDPAPHYAARFAAKEAALKALGIGISPLGIDRALRDIEVVRHGRAPALGLRGRPARRARALGVVDSALSLTHERDSALASVVLLTEASA